MALLSNREIEILEEVGFQGTEEEGRAALDGAVQAAEDEYDHDHNKVIVPLDRDDKWSWTHYELPRKIKDTIDNMATSLLDPKKRKVVVYGHPLTGKTYLIHQLAQHVNNYTRHLKKHPGEIHFYRVSSQILVDASEQVGVESIEDFIDFICAHEFLSEDQVCLVTEEVDLATALMLTETSARIVVEMSYGGLQAVMDSEGSGKTKVWMSLDYYDTEECLSLSVEDMSYVLGEATALDAALFFKSKLVDSEMESLELPKRIISRAVLKNKDLLTKDKKNHEVLVAPFGVWSEVVRSVCSLASFSRSSELRTKKGNFSIAALTDKVMENCEEIFSPFTEDDSDNHIIVSGNGDMPVMFRIATSAEEDEEPQQKEIKPLSYNTPQSVLKTLKQNVIGQDSAIDAVVRGLLVPMAGMSRGNRPLRSYLFCGPTGVGKTETASVLSKCLAKEDVNLVRIDMSEFSEHHEPAKLFGAPPGYVGYESGGILTSAVIENPQSIILLDEIEKAHPDIWDSFLQILDAGRMTDGQGRVADFTNSIIIMTSNIGASEAAKTASGFSVLSDAEAYLDRKARSQSTVTKAIKKTFKPEMINRIDEIVFFNELDKSTIKKIVLKEINGISSRMPKKQTLGSIPSDIVEEILSRSNVTEYGAREVQRVVRKSVEDTIAEAIILGKKAPGTVKLAMSDGQITACLSPAARQRKKK